MKKILLFLLAGLFLFTLSQTSFGADVTPSGIMCTMEAKLCPDGVTYVGRSGPKCEFEACPATTTIPKACTKEYVPVCGQPKMPDCATGMACSMMMPIPTTYANKCVMESEKATLLYEGKCKGELISQDQYQISDKLKVRIDIQISKLTDLIDKKGLDSTQKTILINKIITRLNEKSSESPKVKEAISYIIQKLEWYSAASQNQNLWKLPD